MEKIKTCWTDYTKNTKQNLQIGERSIKQHSLHKLFKNTPCYTSWKIVKN